MDESTWYPLLLFSCWCLCYTRGSCSNEQQVFTHLMRFTVDDWFFFQKWSSCDSHAPYSYYSSNDSLTICLHQCLTLGGTKKYIHVPRALQPITPTIPSENTVAALCQLHPFPLNHVPPFFFYF